MGLFLDPICRESSIPSVSSERQASAICGGSCQSDRSRDFSQRRRHRFRFGDNMAALLALLILTIIGPTYGILLEFDNCLSRNIIKSDPAQLQFVPFNVSVVFDTLHPSHNLNVTVYGNVTGTLDRSVSYPPPDDPQWINPNSTVGKIDDLNEANNKYSTLLTSIGVVNFSPYKHASRFCESVVQGHCPLGPVFYANTYGTRVVMITANE